MSWFVSPLEFIGSAKMADLSKFFKTDNGLYAKLSYMNPSGSIKDRVVINILKEFVDKGVESVVEATSGNTGISLAFWSNYFGIKATVIMPKGMSEERKRMMTLLGANVIEIEGTFQDSIDIAKRIAAENGWTYLGQFSREANPKAYRSLGKELLAFDLDYFVAGIGTGGTLMGVAEVLKDEGVKIVGVLPKERNHGIQGIGDWVESKFWKNWLVDDFFRVSTEDARKFMKQLWKAGFLVGRSSGANIKTALHYSKFGNVATVFPDSWDRYLSLEKV